MVPEVAKLNNQFRLWCFAASMLALAGCSSVSLVPPAGDTPTQALPEGVVPAQGTPSQDASGQIPIPGPPIDGIVAEPVPRPAVSGNHAVIALVDRARLDNGAGRREAAGASLERALRIEPRNAWLWHELAQLRLAQGQYAQAISLAQKSGSFAVKDRRLQAVNWRLIGNARTAQGNPAGAEKALNLAAELEK